MALHSFLHLLASKSATAIRKRRVGTGSTSARRRRKHWSPLFVEALEDRLLFSLADKPAFLLLDSSSESALEVSGNGVVQAPGGTGVVDSTNRSAVDVSGNGYLSASELDIVGRPGTDISGKGKIQATVHAGIASQPDPLASLPVPAQPATIFTASKFSGDLYPGTYANGIEISDKGTVTLHPGLYYVKRGLDISGQANVTGTGVVIYVSPAKGQDGLQMSGQAVLTLSPPTSGTYRGITLFQARSSQEEIELMGNAQLNLVGTIYAAGGQLEITGNGELNGAGDSAHFVGSQFVGGDMEASGNGQITLDARDFNALTLTASLSPTPGTEPDGTLVTNVRNSTISGKTGAFATVALGTNGDPLFGEGTTTADASGNYSLPVVLTRGANTLQVRATLNGQQVTQTIKVTLDTLPPAITVTGFPAGQVTNQNVTMSGQVTDDLSGVASFQAALDNGTFTTVSLGTGGAFNFTTALPLNHSADGVHTEHLQALDYAGNVSSVDVSFTLDTVAPTITVTAPAAGLVTNQNVTIIGQATDDRSGVALLQAALDNGQFAVVTLGAGGAFSFATALALNRTADGPHTEHLRATDNAGNVSSFNLSFTLDTLPPTITVTAPPAGLVTNQNVTITGQITDDRSGVASLQAALDNGTFAVVSLGAAGAFSITTALALDHTADGPHTEHLRATDNAGNASSFDVSFTLDTVPPTITVTAPAAGFVTNQNATITGEITDDRSGVASLQAALDNGTFVAVSLGAAGAFSFATTLPLDHTADGPHTEHLRATDNAGNGSSFDVSFALDTVPPTITVSAPAAGLVTNQNVTITGTVTDDRSGVASLQVALDNGTFAAVTLGTGGAFRFATALALDHSADGPHTEHLRATDSAGNVSSFDISFTLDTVPPTISVTTPAAGLVTNQNVTITGQVTDDRSGVASLQAALDNGQFAAVNLGVGGAFSFATALALDHTADGPHTEHLRATDNAGNVSSFDVSFTLDTVPPTITVTTPAAGLVTNQNVTITGQVTDDRSGVASLQAALDNGQFAAVNLGVGGAFSFATALALDHTADGPHTEHLRATDNAGNVASFDVSFTLDTVPPTITVTAPAAGFVTNQNVTITGRVTDDRSGVASLQAALDNGTFAAVSLGAGGTFSFATALPLDHTADGAHTEHLQATDKAGNLSSFDVAFTLDTVPPTITVTAPAAGFVTNQNVTITGRVTDDRSGAASLQGALDNGTFAAVSLGAGGTFSFATALPLDHTADGAHTEHLQATDKAGNLSSFDVAFTLDTIPPIVTITSPTAPMTTSTNVTISGQATDERSGVAKLEEQVDGGTFLPVTFDAAGNFSFATTLPLDGTADGAHAVQVRAVDNAGNTSALAVYSFTLDTSATRGVTLIEGTRFRTAFQETFTVPSQPSKLQFIYDSLQFDPSNFIQDAFEASLTDANGNSLVLPISTSQDAFLNITDGQAPVISPNVKLNNGTVGVDLSHITPGTLATLTVRLVNNYSDTGTRVHFTNPQIIAATMNTPVAATPAAASPVGSSNIDFSALGDVTTSMTAAYGETSLNEKSSVLLAGLAVKNTGTFPVDAPLVAVINNLSDPSVRVRNADGVTPSGLPYFDLSNFISGNTLASGQSTTVRTLDLYDPKGIQFTYNLQILGQLNRLPTITSQPNTEAIPGLPYVYQATATDPDNDKLTYSLLIAPAGMKVDANSGKITWSPQTSDLGNETVLLQVDDGHGGTAQQQYAVSTIVAPPDRPPLFTSTPVIDANVDTAYAYQATATDPDDDPLTFSLTSGPAGMSVDAKTGLVNWTPVVSQLGTANVMLTVADGRGGMATQSYAITVLQDPKNQPPRITSDPVTNYNVPPISNPPSGSVSPNNIQLTLANGQTSSQTVSASGLSGGPLTLGSLVTGNLGTPGQQDVYTFTLPANALLYFDALSDNGFGGFALLNNTSFQWSLTGTNTNVSRLFTASDGSSYANPVLALPAGAYTLTVFAGDQTTGPYAFRLSDLATATPITPGTPVSGTLNPPASTTIYQFNAVAGQSYYFASLSVTGNALFDDWRLIDPNGTELFNQGGGPGPFHHEDEEFLGNDGGRLTLPSTGTYTILVEGFIPETNLVSYSLNVLPITDTTQALTLGNTVNGNFSAPRQQDTYTFNLPANALLDFDSLTNNLNFQWSLTGPPGTVVNNRLFTQSDAGGTQNPVLALPAGAYTLTVTATGNISPFSATGPTVGPYSFRLSDLTTATVLTPGTPVSSTLNPANSTALYQFSAAAGQSFYFATLALSKPSWRLIDPYGNIVFSTNMQNDGGRLTLAATGVYTVLIEGSITDTGTDSYSFNVAPITDTTQALTLGDTVNATLAEPGQKDSYTFNLAANALLYFDAQTNNAGLQWSLTGPGGSAVNNRSFTASDGESFAQNPVLSLPAGPYTLTISGTGQAAGAYAFRLLNLSAATPLTPGTATNVALNPANSTNLYEFSGNAGDKYTFTAQGAKGNESLRVIDPYGNVVTSADLRSTPVSVTLLATGTYYVAVEGFISDTGPANYTITAQFQGNTPPAPPSGTALTLGSTVSGTIATSSQQDHYVFTLPANALLYFDALSTAGLVGWSLSGPGGVAVSNRQIPGSDAGGFAPSPALALPAGTYILTIAGVDGGTGAYSFRLDNLASATPLTPGTPVSDTLNPANSTNLYQFNAAAGQSYYFASLSSGFVWWRLIDPYGNQLLSKSIANDGGRLTLTASGTYTVLIEGFVGNTGTLSYSFEAESITDTSQALTLGGLVNGNLAAPGQVDTYTFNLAANAILYFDALTNNAGIQWSLTGPPGTVVSNRSFTNTDSINISGDPALALAAGAYALQLSGAGQTTGNYSFRLSNLASASTLTPGTAVSGTLNPANSTNFYQWSASAGQSFYFARLSGTGGSIGDRWRLIDPYGNVVFNDALSTDAGRLTLTGTGTFTVLVEGAITDTGTLNYSFNVAPLTDQTQTQALTLGSTVSGTLAQPGEQDRYTFNLASNAQLYFDSLTNSLSFQWSLIGPPGTVVWNAVGGPNIVNNRFFAASDAIANSGNAAMFLPAGTYTLLVDATGQTAGAYGFRLSDLATATPLTPGTPVNSTLNPANRTDLYQFSATAGQVVYFAHLSGGTNNTSWRLIDPYGNQLFSTRFTNDAGRLTLAAGGIYTVLIEGGVADTGTVNYSFNVAPITDPTQVLTLGSPVNANLASPGEQDHYTFTLSANALVYFDALTNNSALQWSLTGPAGTTVNNLSFTSSDGSSTGSNNPVRALPAGSYTLTVFGTGQTIGTYAFRLSNLTQATPLTPGTPVNSTLNPANSTNLYQFQASAGQSFYFARVSGTTSNAIWRLIDPYGNSLFRLGLGSDAGRLTLGATGTYTLLVEGVISDTGTVSYSFNVAPITDTTQSLTFGGLVNASLAEPGEQDHYTFTLASSALLYFDSLTNNTSFQWSLSGPEGAAVSNLSFTNSDGFFVTNPVLALPAGNYTLAVSATAQTTGAYSFRLSDLGTATALTPGTPVSGTLNPANSTNLYQFSANAGDQYSFVRQGGSALSNADWRLMDPYGNALFDARLGTNEGPLTVLATGTYYLLIEGGITDTGSGTYSFNVQFLGNTPPVFSGTPLTLGSTVNGNLTTAGQQDHYIFTLAAHAQLYFDSLTNDGNIVWSLSGPAGTAVRNSPFNSSDAGGNSNPALDLPAGNYTLTVSGSGQTTGAYAFRLDDMAAAGVLTPGTAVSGSLVPSNSTNLYQFQATAGQTFYFARISGSGGSFSDRWRLIDPYGNVVFTSFLSQDAGRVTLTAAGTYTLLVEGTISNTGTESYSFNVFPMADVSQPLTLGSLINGTLAAPGQQDHYSFALSANALLYFDSLTNNNNLQWSLSGPGGVVASRTFNNSDATNNSNPVMSLTAGNYVLTVNAPAPTTGPYSFRLSNLASAVPVNFDTQVSGRLNPGNSTNLYQFTANAGDSYYFESLKIPFALSGSQSTAIWRLVDPYGNILFSTNVGTDAGRITMPATGAYTLLIEGAILNPVETGYAFQIDQPQVNLVASDPNVPFVNQTGPVTNINAPSFNVQFAGDGQAQGFDVQFVSTATGIVLASVPVTIDTSYLYQVRAVDPQGYPLTYSLTQAPSGMTIDPTTGLISWIPTAAQVGQNSVTVQVEDTHGGTDAQSFVVTVTSLSPGGIQGTVYNDQNGDGSRDGNGSNPPPPPGPFLPAGTAFPGIGVDKSPAIIITIGPDGALTVTSTSQTKQPPYDSSDDTYVGVVNESNSGVALQGLNLSSALNIFGFDGDGIGSGSFVPGGNASNEGKTGYEGPGTSFTNINEAFTAGTVNFNDGLGDGLEPGLEAYFALEGVPATVDGTIVKQELPANLEPGLAGLTVYLDLNHTGQLAPNDPETQTDALGHYFFSNLTPGTYSVAEVTTAALVQTAPPSGTYTAVVQSGQITSGLDFGNKVVTNPVPRPPKITSTAPTTAAAGQTYRYAVSVFNPDDDVLSFDLPVKPDGMVVDALTGIIDWEPTESQLGSQNVVLRLKDDKGDVLLQSFTVQVDEESPPVITSTPPSQPAQTGLPYQYQVQAQDAQNDPITYSLLQPPAGMTIDPHSGLLSWVGPQVGPGLPSGYAVTIQADNGVGGQTTQTYTVLVITPGFDQPPVITSHPPKFFPPAPPGVHGTTLYYQVIANSPSGNPLTYSLTVAPIGMTINSTGLLHWVAFLTDIGSHPVTIQVQDSRGLTVTQSFTIDVTFNFSSVQGPAITSVPPELARSGIDYEYDATANDPNNVPVIWSLDTAPAGMSVNAMTGTVRWTPNLNQLGSSSVVLRATDTDGGFSTQGFSITVVSGDIPPNIVSTPPTQGTVGHLYTYAVQAKDVEGNTLTYSLVTAPTGMVINSSTGLIQWVPTAAQLGSQAVVINVSDGQGGGAVQGYNIVVSSKAGSQPPNITSVPPLLTSAGQLYSYQVAATDPQGETLSYSLINAPPTGMSINATSGLVQWTPATTQQGANPVLVAVTNTDGEIATQNFTITVQPPNTPPVINSTAVTTVTAGAPYTYDVLAADPDNDALTYSLTTAPTGMTIDALGRITWSPQIADIGSHPVNVTVSDGRGSTVSQQYTIAVIADTVPPSVLLILDANPVDLGTPDAVVVTATDNVGVTGLTLTLNGTPVPLDTMGRATLPDTTAGNFTLVATASDAAGNVGTTTQTLVVINPKVTNAPTVAITTPADNGVVTAPTQVIGTVQDPNLVSYTFSVAPVGSANFTTFFTGTSQVNNAALGTFDPSMLQNDSYDLRLTATNTGGLSSVADVTVNVAQNLKLGNFTLSFTDLTVPVSGIPITVTRTYDTLTANQSGDFGFGWRLEFRDVDLRTSVTKTGEEANGFFNPFKDGSRVYVTLPGGQREGFTFQPKVADGVLGSFIGVFTPKFVPDAGVTDSLSVSPADLGVDADGTFHDFETGIPYNPADPNFGGSYLLTTRDSLAYNIDGITGQLTEVSDSNNNTLTLSDAGVKSSTGTGITFERDPQGRIVAVVDPMGNKINYQYDANGNLVASTDRTNDTTQYVYLSTPAHYLDKVIDPLGRTAVRTNYDAQGRLSQIIGVDGKSVQLSYDVTNSTVTTKDPLGNPTTLVYDARGNTVTTIDALGGITHSTFDGNNNLLTRSDPMGRTQTFTYDSRGDALTKTDPLGNTTILTYKAFTFFTTALAASRGEAAAPFTRATSSTNPLGNPTAYTQNFFGSYTSVTDPMGNTISVLPDTNGQPLSATDAAGNTTQIQYDAAGHPLLVTTPLGIATAYTSDADGNQLTSTGTLTAADGSVRTVVSTSAYDTQGRLMSFTDANGGVRSTEYDAAGNTTATVDALGRRTQYVYDQNNRLSETIAPDGSATQTQYDADGRQTATVDELGRMTQYQYDALGRLLKTTYPEGSSTQTEYDADGEVTAQVDQLGNRTEYAYDADGHRIATTDALGNLSTSVYDAAGRLTAQTDPLHNTTKFVYDANGQHTETDFADGTKTQTTVDVRGLVIAKTNQLGQTTDYQYDADRRLTLVTDPLGNQTAYTYDERGDQLTSTTTQTAADGTVRTLTTRMAYDNLGRLIAVTNPDGAVTRTQYDLAGEKTATIDALGRTTQYVYNTRGELIETIYSDGTHTANQYDAAGELTASIDEAGRKTEYQYDLLGRLVKTIYPDGTSTQTKYDADGQVIAQINELGNSTAFQYDAGGRQTLVTDALGDTIRFTYDADGRKISQTDALNHTTPYVYDALGRLVETDYADGTKTTSTYDARGQLIASTDQLGRTTRYEYDADGRQTALTDPLGQRTQYAYDEYGALIRKTDANGHATVYEHDREGRQTAVFLPALSGQAPFATIMQYDADGNVVSTTDYNGNTIHFVYDARNRLLTKNYLDGTSVIYTYTLTGQVATVMDARGTTTYVYDARDRLLSCTEPDGMVVSYTYDAAGDRTALRTPAGTTSYTFDALGRQLMVTDPNGGVTAYTYDARGNLIRTILPNGLVESRGYDALDRLDFLQDVNGATAVASYTYTLGSTGLIDEVVENTGRTVAYTYDSLDRLTQEKITDAVFGNRTIAYTYDAVGNRLTMDDSALGLTTDTYDAMDRLVTSTLSGQVTQYTYDKNGNLLTEVSPTEALFYQYDFDNRLIAAGANGGTSETNAYDPAGNLVSQTVGSKVTRFLMDTLAQYPAVVMEYAPDGTIRAAYVYGARLISQLRSGVLSVYLIDGQQNTRQLTSAAGNVTDQYIYDAFGRMLSQSGTTVNRYLFAGQQTDAVTGLDYMRARYYDPRLGRFTSADPLRQSSIGEAGAFQFYAYTNNDPVNHTDPSGKLPDLISQLGASVILGVLASTLSQVSSVIRLFKSGGKGLGAFLTGILAVGPLQPAGRVGQYLLGQDFAVQDIPLVGGVIGSVETLASDDASASGVLDKIAAGINLLATGIGLAQGGAAYSKGLFTSAPKVINPPADPVQANAYGTTSAGLNETLDVQGPGDPGDAPVLATDPATGEQTLYLPTGGIAPTLANPTPASFAVLAVQRLATADNLVLVSKVDYSFFETSPNSITPSGRDAGPLSAGGRFGGDYGVGPNSFSEAWVQTFLSEVNNRGGWGQVKSVTFLFREGDSLVHAVGPIDVGGPAYPPGFDPLGPTIIPVPPKAITVGGDD